MADDSRTGTAADVVYDAVHAGAIGGSVVALFFLVIDALNGQPLFTPSLMGSVLFEGAAASGVGEVRLDMVAYYSIVHFATFGALGAGAAFLVHEVEIHSRHPGEVLAFFFVLFEAGFFVSAALFLPGVIEVLGVFRLFVVNLLAAGSMGLFLLSQHRPDLWQKFRHAAHLG